MVKFPYSGGGLPQLQQDIESQSPDFLRTLFFQLLRIRRVEESVADRYHEDRMKTPIHLAIGQEAVAVGCAAVWELKDHVFCGHRSHAVYLAKGGDLNAMISEFHCKLNGCAGSRGGSMHLLDKKVGMMGSSAIVAGVLPIATGSALAAKQKHKDRATIVFVGDAAMEEGAAWESLNFAVLKKLPILYVCENNFYSVCSPLEYRQPPGVSIRKKAESFGLYTEEVDGNNVLAVYKAAARCLNWIREGKGPAFIEAFTYRWRGHHGAEEDGNAGYRTQEEIDEWKKSDPVALMRQALVGKRILNEAQLEQMEQKIKIEIEAAFQHALSSPDPTEADLFTHVYSD